MIQGSGWGGNVGFGFDCRGSRIYGEGLRVYPLSAETLDPLARFNRKLPKHSEFADEGFPGLTNRGLFGSFGTNHLCFQRSEPDKV